MFEKRFSVFTCLLVQVFLCYFQLVNPQKLNETVGLWFGGLFVQDIPQALNKAFLDSGNEFAPEDRKSDDINILCINSATDPTFRDTTIDDPELAKKLNRDIGLALVVHGWTDNGYRKWIKNMAIDLATFYNVNACTVNWQSMSLQPYDKAAYSTRTVAQHLTKFIQYLTGEGFDLSKITLFGHSMGAQICGFIGASFGGRIPLIVGMDPAGWGFTKPIVLGIENRLDPSDAMYVQAIHTNDDFLGVNLDVGHQDFYANTGRSPQPGCGIMGTFGLKRFVAEICSHYRAVDITRSMIRGTKYQSLQCESYQSYARGLCINNAADVPGINGERQITGRFYFTTDRNFPFTL